jgi:hypothetical protein
MKKFENPQVEIENIELVDVITTSELKEDETERGIAFAPSR